MNYVEYLLESKRVKDVKPIHGGYILLVKGDKGTGYSVIVAKRDSVFVPGTHYENYWTARAAYDQEVARLDKVYLVNH